jgi:hypothetical protein
MGSRRGPCRAHSDAQPANKTIRWIELFLDSVADDQQGILGALLGGVIPRPCVQARAPLHQAGQCSPSRFHSLAARSGNLSSLPQWALIENEGGLNA